MAYTCDYCKKTVYFAEKQFRKGLDYHGSCLQKKILEEKIKRVSLRGGLINKEMPTKEQLETVSNQAKDLTVKGIDQLKEDNKVKLQQMRKAKQLQNQKSNGEHTSNIPMKSVLDRESKKNIHQNDDQPENCPHDVFKSNQKYFPMKNGDNSTTTTTTTTSNGSNEAPKKKVIIRKVIIKKVVKKSNGSTTPTTEPNGTNHTTENHKTEEPTPKTTTPTTTTTNKVEEEDPLEKRMRERREMRERKRLEEEKKRQEELEQKQREYEELKERILQQKREEALKNNEPEPVDDFDDEPIEDLEDEPIEDENYNQPITSDNLDEDLPIDDEYDGEILDDGEDFDEEGGELAFCPECGMKQSDPTAKFCEDCGQPLDI